MPQKWKKKTCNRCKALCLHPGTGAECALGYKLDPDTAVPMESCPKPLTYLDYIELRRDMQFRKLPELR